jgi:hypothetical protein
MGDGETHSGDKDNWRRRPDPAEENIARVLGGGEPAEAEPLGTLGELVRFEPDAADFLAHYSTSDLGGEGRVDGMDLQDPLKRGLHALSERYDKSRSIKELQELLDTMKALGRTDEYSVKALSIYQDFIDYLAFHDPVHQMELAAKKARALEEAVTQDTKPVEVVEDIPETPPATFASTPQFLTADEQLTFQEMTRDFLQADSIRLPRSKPAHRRSGRHGQ